MLAASGLSICAVCLPAWCKLSIICLRSRKRDPMEDLRREIAIMRRMLHPNIVALREARSLQDSH